MVAVSMDSSVVSRNFFANANTTTSATSTSVEWVNIVTKNSSSMTAGRRPRPAGGCRQAVGGRYPAPRPLIFRNGFTP